MLDLATATLETFAPHVGTDFVLDHPEHEESFTLVQADPLISRTYPPEHRSPFSLLFHGRSAEIQFNQQILPLKHDALGALNLFFVPIARNEDGTIRYQALFN